MSMTTFADDFGDDEIRRDEFDELHGQAGGWFEKDTDELFWAVGLIQVDEDGEVSK